MTQHRNLVAHGSNRRGIAAFEPRKQTLFSGKPAEAVFATKDGVWPLFYAVLDREKVADGFRNGCFRTRPGRRFYFFSLTRQTMDNGPWTSGVIYMLPGDTFRQAPMAPLHVDEWISRSEVRPTLQFEVAPADFGYADRVAVHQPGESIAATGLLYKWRTRAFRRAPHA